MPKLILASRSPRRKKLLEQIGLAFEIYPGNFDEKHNHSKTPENLVTLFAYEKARSVANDCPDSIIIGADTVVVLDDQILEKPSDESDAYDMLSRLSGRTHSVYSGVSFVKTDKKGIIIRDFSFYEQTKVTFTTLTEQEIYRYIKSGSPMDKAGSYGIQDDWGALFVERIEGDFYNVVGFPLSRFYRELKKFNPDSLNID